MKYLTTTLVVFIAGLLLYAVFFRAMPQQKQNEADKTVRTTSAQAPKAYWEAKVDDQPPVTVKITPVAFGKSMNTWTFAVAFDTHSGSLDEDPLKAITLLDDKGNVFQPILWDGPEAGGHHREGILTFNAIDPTPSYVELKVKNIGGVSVRSFAWTLE